MKANRPVSAAAAPIPGAPYNLRRIRDVAREIGGEPPDPPSGGGGGAHDDEPDEIVDPKAPWDIAHRVIASQFTHSHGRTLHHWRGGFLIWNGGQFEELDGQSARDMLYPWLAACRKRTSDGATVKVNPNQRFINNLIDALRSAARLASRVEPPSWLDGDDDRPPAREFMAVANGVLHLPERVLYPPTPAFFATACSPIGFDENAQAPEWHKFLASVWPGDQQSIDCLQTIFGYIVSGDLAQQKIFALIGASRSGKGTIAKVIQKLLGEKNHCSPTLSSLTESFGSSALIGKSLAVISDAQLGKQSDRARIAEELLTISGMDSRTLSRKFLDAWTGVLPTRIMLLSNAALAIPNTSGALARRLIVLNFPVSFEGREDFALEHKLAAELPGILAWSIEGWHKLRAEGRFVQPESGLHALEIQSDLGSPMRAFLRQRCELTPEAEIGIDALYAAFEQYRADQNIDGRLTKPQFGRDLHAVYPSIKTGQPRDPASGTRTRVYYGITLKPGVPAEPPEPEQSKFL